MVAPAPSLASGSLLGAFRIVRFIARGGMGEVYEAINTISGARRALKVVRAELLGDADMRARFVRETTLASHIKHPNVVEAWDPMLENGSVVLPMELLEGESLAERLQRSGPLDIDEALSIAAAVADGVAAFHARGVIHRDLKPGNVFLAHAGGAVVPKILDFGAARVLGDERHTMTGHVVGSPAYMAPEQAMAARDLDGRVDVYALGVILYAMLTGRRPYESDEHGSAIAKLIQRRAYTPLEVLRSSVDPESRALVARALAWEREARWQSMQELAHAIRAVLASREGGPARDSLTARPLAVPAPLPLASIGEHTRVMDAAPPIEPVRSLRAADASPPAPVTSPFAPSGDTSSVRLPVRSSWLVLGCLFAVGLVGALALGVVALLSHAAAPAGAAGSPGPSLPDGSFTEDAGTVQPTRTASTVVPVQDAGLDAATELPDASARRGSGRAHAPPRGLWLEPEPTSP